MPVLTTRWTPSTPVALDVVDFVGQHLATPTDRSYHEHMQHEHFSFSDFSKILGEENFRADIELIFARNGLAFTVDNDMHVRRLGPLETRPLLREFNPKTGDPELDAKLHVAVARFQSRTPQDRIDALKDLWDGFERLKTLESPSNKKTSIKVLIERASKGSSFLEHLNAEAVELTRIGNQFQIRHFEHGTSPLPSPVGIAEDYLFTRLLALIAYLLRQTGRL